VAGIMAAATAEKLARLLGQVASRDLRVNVEARVPLDRADEAVLSSPTAASARSSSRAERPRRGSPAYSAEISSWGLEITSRLYYKKPVTNVRDRPV
jgi:hypothetical protein